MRSSIIEGFKELGRVALIAAIPLLVTSIESGHVDYKVLLTAVSIAVLRALDKWVHEEPNIKSNGILPF